ncbi:hypothetical protein UMZ34_18335 [Halopseudomonas pachastrellae]|nr:hypothetical protein UMZ34_18335 [Halopseudomonas pachastrellae]
MISLECDNLDVLKRVVRHSDALSIGDLDILHDELSAETLTLLDWPELLPGTSFVW